jgi:MFS family permease
MPLTLALWFKGYWYVALMLLYSNIYTELITSQLYGQLYYIPFYFLSVRLNSPLRTGVSLLPVTLTLVPGSVVAGAIITRLGQFRWAIWTGWAITALACGLTILWDISTHTGAWVIILIILGFGHALVLNSQNFATQAICHNGDEGSAAAMYAFLRSFGTALGVGLGGSVFQNVMKTKLVELGLPTDIANHAESYIITLRSMPDSPTKTHILEAYVYGFHGVYGCFCSIAGLAGIVSLFIKHYDMNKVLESEHKLHENRISRLLNDHDRQSHLDQDTSAKEKDSDLAAIENIKNDGGLPETPASSISG